MKRIIIFFSAFFLVLAALPATAVQPVKIGMITTLSTKAGYLGEEIRDGFQLAIDLENGRLGGIPVQLLIGDDGRKPEKGRQLAERFIQKDHVKILTGLVFSNVAMAVVPKVVRQGIFVISPNAGPSQLAGKGCQKNYFNVSWQTDNLSEVIGQYATEQGYKNVFIIAPNYIAGKDNVAGFKRFYKGRIAGELYTTLGQADYAAEIAALRSAAPDAVYFFLPGGMGINFLKQYAQSGLSRDIPLMGPAATDERLLHGIGAAALGVINSSQWCVDFHTPANEKFVAAFTKKYGRTPTLFASQGYDTARLIGSALAAVKGDMSRTDDFRRALEKADFTSVRGAFRFGPNHFPIQDFYVRRVMAAKDGGYTNRMLKKVFHDHSDAYAGQCNL
ncbi:MAG TPA: ABC transporter substrate-binding protein [Desulfobulbaceae bacterium]|nr:ABC transporter substrate-binding protein [Desulfobulbaceae bacterium]